MLSTVATANPAASLLLKLGPVAYRALRADATATETDATFAASELAWFRRPLAAMEVSP